MCATYANGPQLFYSLLLFIAARLAAQLARTEEAAKRVLIRSDATAKGGTAQQLLDAQKELQRLRAENTELASKLSRCFTCCYEIALRFVCMGMFPC